MMAVDEMYADLPMMERDRYWNDSNPRPPYTAATLFVLRKPSFQGSTFDMAYVLAKPKHTLGHTRGRPRHKRTKRLLRAPVATTGPPRAHEITV